MIINSKWWEEHDNLVTLVQYQCKEALAKAPDGGFGECGPMVQEVVVLHEAIEEPQKFRAIFVSALLSDLEAVICRCGACNGREWTNGSKLHEHFCDLLDNGRSLNFAEPQEEEAV